MAIDNNGKLLSWGESQEGQLGLGQSIVSIDNPTYIKNFINNIETAIFVNNDNNINCNYLEGNFKNNTCLSYNIIKNQEVNYNNLYFIKISISNFHCVALDNNGNIYTWGTGKYGELCLDQTVYSSNPTIFNASSKIYYACCYDYITCIIDVNFTFSYYGLILNKGIGSKKLSQINTIKKLHKKIEELEAKNDNNQLSNNNFSPIRKNIGSKMFKKKVIEELNEEIVIFCEIGNGFVVLLTDKGLVFTLDENHYLCLVFSDQVITSINVVENNIIGISNKMCMFNNCGNYYLNCNNANIQNNDLLNCSKIFIWSKEDNKKNDISNEWHCNVYSLIAYYNKKIYADKLFIYNYLNEVDKGINTYPDSNKICIYTIKKNHKLKNMIVFKIGSNYIDKFNYNLKHLNKIKNKEKLLNKSSKKLEKYTKLIGNTFENASLYSNKYFNNIHPNYYSKSQSLNKIKCKFVDNNLTNSENIYYDIFCMSPNKLNQELKNKASLNMSLRTCNSFYYKKDLLIDKKIKKQLTNQNLTYKKNILNKELINNTEEFNNSYNDNLIKQYVDLNDNSINILLKLNKKYDSSYNINFKSFSSKYLYNELNKRKNKVSFLLKDHFTINDNKSLSFTRKSFTNNCTKNDIHYNNTEIKNQRSCSFNNKFTIFNKTKSAQINNSKKDNQHDDFNFLYSENYHISNYKFYENNKKYINLDKFTDINNISYEKEIIKHKINENKEYIMNTSYNTITEGNLIFDTIQNQDTLDLQNNNNNVSFRDNNSNSNELKYMKTNSNNIENDNTKKNFNSFKSKSSKFFSDIASNLSIFKKYLNNNIIDKNYINLRSKSLCSKYIKKNYDFDNFVFRLFYTNKKSYTDYKNIASYKIYCKNFNKNIISSNCNIKETSINDFIFNNNNKAQNFKDSVHIKSNLCNKNKDFDEYVINKKDNISCTVDNVQAIKNYTNKKNCSNLLNKNLLNQFNNEFTIKNVKASNRDIQNKTLNINRFNLESNINYENKYSNVGTMFENDVKKNSKNNLCNTNIGKYLKLILYYYILFLK